jgi:predicted NBD/HSP70 family sugar kinase
LSNTVNLKRENILKLIKTAFISKLITKPELSKATRLTLPTVHNFINELLASNIVKVSGAADSKGGRRATLYAFNTSLFQILAVRMTLNRIDVGLFDIGFKCLDKRQCKIDFLDITVEDGMKQIISCIAECLQTWNVERKSLLGIGVTFPGPVDPVSGVVRILPNLRHWSSVPAKATLERALGIPVLIEKDSLSNVVALKWLDHANRHRNVAFVAIELGVGIGLLNNSRLYRGVNCMMGEIGHISIDPTGPFCACGNRGCLELYASDIGIIQRIQARVRLGQDTVIGTLCHNQPERIDMPMILRAEKMGDKAAREEMELCSKYIAICVVNIVKLYDPEKIIIGHQWLGDYPDMFQKLLDTILSDPLFINRESAKIELNPIDNIELKAAAAILIDHQFSSVDNCSFVKLLNER